MGTVPKPRVCHYFLLGEEVILRKQGQIAYFLFAFGALCFILVVGSENEIV